MEDPVNGSGHELLLRLIDSPEFDLYLCINYLQKYADNIGIHYYLCQRASKYPISELRFFIPQFLQLLITVETESVALEEMLRDLCTRDVHCSLITFWHLQALLQELSKTPESIGFQTCKRMLNDLQFQLFNFSNNHQTVTSSTTSTSGVVTKHEVHKLFRENVAPSIILASSLISGVTVPQSTKCVEPIVRIQGKQLKSLVFEVVKDIKKSLNENLTKKNTINNAFMGKSKEEVDDIRLGRVGSRSKRSLPSSASGETHREELNFEMIDSYADINMPSLSRPSIKPKKSSLALLKAKSDIYDQPVLNSNERLHDHAVSSMPNLHVTSSNNSLNEFPYSSDGSYASSIRNSFDYRDSSEIESIYGEDTISPNQTPTSRSSQKTPLSESQKVKLLKSNYFKYETQFVIALQNISIRLAKVPKEARLSTLKAELATLNKDLPCEVDIPGLLPKNKKGKLHKVCKIAVNEAAVLNSAERVPYLLLIEYLSDEIDFDPETPDNKKVLHKLKDDKGVNDTFKLSDKKYRFDLAYPNTPSSSSSINSAGRKQSSIPKEAYLDTLAAEESDLADISVVKMSNKIEKHSKKPPGMGRSKSSNPRLEPDSPSTEVIEQKLKSLELTFKYQYEAGMDSESELANQMRIAAVMLTQLESPTSTMPTVQANEIKARIIDSMKEMQHGFGVEGLKEFPGEAGERKLSNDLKVAGISYLGEDWNTKKARIRAESKYGHLENWDLFSVIAKTGDDLTQEAFACQLIQAMAKIWYQENVKVWVKRMRILVTSSTTGLVETITNALSIHSIKKSLTQYLSLKNENPRGEIATLKDHFLRMFGDESSPRYKLAQENFCMSLAAYSVICYLLQIKDRHNGNIMLDSEGHIVHIDFGFLLSNSPGSVRFEAAPFKLTMEYVDLLGGEDSVYFQKFRSLMKDAFRSLRKHANSLVNMVELMQKDSQLPCFKAGANTSVQMKQRFQLHLSDEELDLFIDNVLINKSLGSIYTRLYDQYQLLTQGIYI
ncbi:hypothetical protein OGAPHI_000394 [Ogataea philodendri]|uniref:1-phosphatidylinositol 4-kinase n=1 Tax=Ogataea philodendri TaxID=1378263 RepID=A0A9P8TAJ9_9ASCO|nr:uncharacterized protein OGAPHI_000394 [Ogataea philodendri]KAH3671689.1 hypothetical protein OGAPHI_000394 [Ogataea philodendri]